MGENITKKCCLNSLKWQNEHLNREQICILVFLFFEQTFNASSQFWPSFNAQCYRQALVGTKRSITFQYPVLAFSTLANMHKLRNYIFRFMFISVQLNRRWIMLDNATIKKVKSISSNHSKVYHHVWCRCWTYSVGPSDSIFLLFLQGSQTCMRELALFYDGGFSALWWSYNSMSDWGVAGWLQTTRCCLHSDSSCTNLTPGLQLLPQSNHRNMCEPVYLFLFLVV